MSRSTTASHLIGDRLARLRKLLPELGLDALLISQPENRAYLSGFTGSAGVLLIGLEHALIATDFRFYEQVSRECPQFELVRLKRLVTEVLPEMVQTTGASKVGFEADNVAVATFETWKSAAPGVAWHPTQELVVRLRAVKDQAEIAALRCAVELTDQSLACALAEAEPGMTEKELAWSIERHMRTNGADGVAFDLMVAGGPNSALPHADPSDAPLLPGEPIVIDIGAKVDGYHGDMTRTVCFGEPNDPIRFWEVYNTVLRAQATAEAGIRPELSGPDADALARDVIAQAGYGEQFGHGLGHGVGLQIHEMPMLGRTSTSTIQPGMLVTIEPGIYLPGWGGVRIEDIVLITENGAEVLTHAPKEPIL